MRYLAPAALTASSLVLLLAAEGMPGPTAGGIPAAAPVAAVLPATAGAAAPARPAAGAAPAPAPAKPAPPPVVIRGTRLAEKPGRRALAPARIFTGTAFDACTAPPLETMRAWKEDSPYGAVGIYVSGGQRGCAQPRLTAGWVREVRAMGWQLIPTHVGLQAPCATLGAKPHRIDPAAAVRQGKEEAAEAAAALRALGLGPGSPVYLDIESYPRGDRRCSQGVVDFTLSWTRALHAAGFRSGFYSSTDSGIADLAAAARAGASPLPDALWYARWDDRADTTSTTALDPGQWSPHARIHQYRGNTTETHGGATLAIDHNAADAPVAT
ncbi:DUF1906 domain-containing protein [Kitasatospora sp. NPDC096147]|uniref:DUF1906 domain-containing protein n=1 Tax=Kitasatospora sp. NPDC096147 TaxID=3364093 RepID=UPI0037FCEEA5